MCALGVIAYLLCTPTAGAHKSSWSISPATASRFSSPHSEQAKLGAILRGEKIYRKHCTGCHGVSGRPSADSPILKRLGFVPRVDSSALETQSDGELFVKITLGKRPMLSYRRSLKDNQRWDLVAFLRTLGRVPQDRPGVVNAQALLHRF
jgi:mono/diheme cytochrome c family protein